MNEWVERKSGSAENAGKTVEGAEKVCFLLFDAAFALPDFYMAGLAKLGGFA